MVEKFRNPHDFFIMDLESSNFKNCNKYMQQNFSSNLKDYIKNSYTLR